MERTIAIIVTAIATICMFIATYVDYSAQMNEWPALGIATVALGSLCIVLYKKFK